MYSRGDGYLRVAKPFSTTTTSARPTLAEHPAKRRKTESEGGETEQTPQKNSLTSLPLPESQPLAADALSPPPSTKYTHDDLATLVIGSDEHEMVVYGHVLAEYSTFFDAALKKGWKEGQTRIIRLPEEDTKTVTHYLDLIYGQGLPTEAIEAFEHFGAVISDYIVLANLYAFRERTLNTATRIAVIEEIIRMVSIKNSDSANCVPCNNAISVIYQSTPVS
jgi:hypothetical protein